MRRTLTALALLVALTPFVDAARVPSSKAERTNNPGAAGDITVPYLTNAGSTLGVWQGVSPIIAPSPGLGGPKGDTERPVFNLIFYGSQKAPSPAFDFATQRQPNQLRPGR
jgi:hypothetical protein